MNLRFLETFIWVARLHSFSLAAEKLCTTQASVSNRIATLERDLGVRLLERDLRSVSLTAQGQKVLPQAEAIVQLVAKLQSSVGAPERIHGTIRIGAIDSIVYAWLPHLIERVKVTYPQVTIDLTVDTSLNIARHLQDGHVDLGLIMGPVVAPHVHNIALCTFTCLWVASPTLDLPRRRLHLADLLDHPIFAYSRGSQPHQAVIRAFAMAGLDPTAVRIFNSTSLATVSRLIRDGVGIAILPRVVVQDFLDSHQLVILDVDATLPLLHLHAVFGDDPMSPLPRLIADMAVDIASKFPSA